jgi:hypothetical protein
MKEFAWRIEEQAIFLPQAETRSATVCLCSSDKP